MTKDKINEKLLFFIKESVPEGMLVIDSEGLIHFANNATGFILNQQPEELKGRELDVAFGEGFFSNICNDIKFFKDKEIVVERQIYNNNDNAAYVRCRIHSFMGGDNISYLIHIQDISEIRQYQKTIRKQQDEASCFIGSDVLPGLLNTYDTRERIRKEIEISKAEENSFSHSQTWAADMPG